MRTHNFNKFDALYNDIVLIHKSISTAPVFHFLSSKFYEINFQSTV